MGITALDAIVSAAECPPGFLDRPESLTSVAATYADSERALANGEPATALAAGRALLEQQPGDPRSLYLVGRAELALGDDEAACRALEVLVERDPENVDGLAALGTAYHDAGRRDAALAVWAQAFELEPDRADVRDWLSELRHELTGVDSEPALAPAPAVIRWRLRRGDAESALQLAQEQLAAHPRDVLLQLLRAEALWRGEHLEDAERACRQLLTRHPRLITPQLLLGVILASDPAREVEGVELIHASCAEDLAGVVARRLFEATSVYVPILADDVAIPLLADRSRSTARADAENSASDHLAEQPAAKEAARYQGINSRPREIEDSAIEDNQASDADQQPMVADLAVADEPILDETLERSRSSVVIVEQRSAANCLIALTSRGRLLARYGQEAIERLDRRLRAVRRELATFDTELEVVFVDEASTVADLGGLVAATSVPESIRSATQRMIRVLRERRCADHPRQNLTFLLLGGDEVVPCFRIANPADDDDREVLTDNPYGAPAGASTLVPAIPVGRLPDGSSGNASLLLRQLDLLVDARRRPRLPPRPRGLTGLGRRALHSLGLRPTASTPFIYATRDLESIASLSVGALAPGALVRACPPATIAEFDFAWLAGRRCLQLGLCGRSDGVLWFGQALPGDDDTWSTPVALSADRLAGVDLDAAIVFAATGYSAGPSDPSGPSVAERLLSEGAAGLVGSTGQCYGSSVLPLVGSDLLARHFWSSLEAGAPVGGALLAAKRAYAQEVGEAQGYLDGDDQKTLLAFTLFGDPLLPVFAATEEPTGPTADVSWQPAPSLGRLVDAVRNGGSTNPAHVRAAVELIGSQYPELRRGAVRIHRRFADSRQLGDAAHVAFANSSRDPSLVITTVTARAEVPLPDGRPLVRIARVTLASDGNIVKTVVGR